MVGVVVEVGETVVGSGPIGVEEDEASVRGEHLRRTVDDEPMVAVAAAYAPIVPAALLGA